jgi:flagellar motor switch protein FliN/FliY
MADSDIEQGLEGVAQAAADVAAAVDVASTAATTPAKKPQGRTLEFILDVALQVTVEVGRARMTIHDLLQLGQGSVVELEKLAGEPLDIFINGKAVARGEAVIVNEKFGVRLTDIISPEDRIEGLERR